MTLAHCVKLDTKRGGLRKYPSPVPHANHTYPPMEPILVR